jgi:regulator of cell morphogenesis and NO signaling
MTTNGLGDLTIGEIVANNFRAASVFKDAGIDFCCGGKKSLHETCKDKGLNKAVLEKILMSLENEDTNPTMNFKDWDLGFLCDYIMNTHHKFVIKNLPPLVFYTQKIATVHGDHHAELIEIADLFGKISDELNQHLTKEEEVLFPAIKMALSDFSADNKETIRSEISRMTVEHEFAGGAMDRIRRISNDYQVPEDGCNTYQVTYKLLEQFEDDLHVHVHLENNILYPKALKLSET